MIERWSKEGWFASLCRVLVFALLGQTILPALAAPEEHTVASTLDLPPGLESSGAGALVQLEAGESAARAAASAAVSAEQLGRAGLADGLEDLGISITDLSRALTDPVFKSQVLANLDRLVALLDDPLLAPFNDELLAARDIIDAASPQDLPVALEALGPPLEDLDELLLQLVAHDFELQLRPSSAIAPPDTPTRFTVFLRNIGTDATTYDIALAGVPQSVAASIDRGSVTLAHGESTLDAGNEVVVTLTQPAAELPELGFAVVVSVAGSPHITRRVEGAFTARNETVRVVEVSSNPRFTEPGGPVNVFARILTAVNEERQGLISYTVRDPEGDVVFTSTPRATELTVASKLETIALGPLDTTGFTRGVHTLEATVTEEGGTALASGTGTLLIGSPVTAELSLDPQAVASGDAITTARLEVKSENSLGNADIELVGLVDTPGSASGVAVRSGYAYVCGSEEITVVDIIDPENPTPVGSFDPVPNPPAGRARCYVFANRLFSYRDQSAAGGAVFAAVWDLTDPTAPALLGSTADLGYTFLNGGFVRGARGFLSNLGFALSGSDISDQWGTFLSVDLSSGTPAVLDSLFDDRGGRSGGDFSTFPGAFAGSGVALVPSTTSVHEKTNEGIGRVLVVNVGDAANLSLIRTVEIPGTILLTGLAVDGNRALVTGNTGGWSNPQLDLLEPGPVDGTNVLTTLDIADPLNPVLVRSVANPTIRNAIGQVALGGGRFALGGYRVGGPPATGDPILIAVDASDLQNPVVALQSIDDPIEDLVVSEGLVLAAEQDAGLAIYRINEIGPTTAMARVEIPKGTGVSILPDTFNDPSVSVVIGGATDVIEWTTEVPPAPGGAALTWQFEIDALQPNEVREVVRGATIDFEQNGIEGEIELAGLAVSSATLLTLDPSERTANPGVAASYELTVSNPLDQPETYDLALFGLPAAWTNLPRSVTLEAESTTVIDLVVRAESAALGGEYGFTVVADGFRGSHASVPGTLVVAGPPVTPDAHGVVVSLMPSEATAGQGAETEFVLQITNTGSVTEVFTLSTDLPIGIAATFEQQVVEVPPGPSNFRRQLLLVTPDAGIVGDFPFTLSAVSTTTPGIDATAGSVLRVDGHGVRLDLDPPSGPPDSSFQLTVTNTGMEEDTFDLALAGPLESVASLGVSEVTVAAAGAQQVTIAVPRLDSAPPGEIELTATASSRGNPDVRDSAGAIVVVAVRKGLAAAFDPPVVETLPGATATLVLEARNTGNVDDAYAVAIVGTTGDVTASLIGLDGLPTQSVPIFPLPALAAGTVAVEASRAEVGEGTVTVSVTSLSDPSITQSATAILRAVEEVPTPTLSPTSTPTPSETPTPSSTAGVTPATPTPTISPTRTPTITSLPTPTITPVATPTITPIATPTRTATASLCAGDCDRDGLVSVDELIRGVRIGLGSLPLTMCPDLDASGEGSVTVDEPVLAVRHALNGCPGSSTAG